MMTKFEEVLIKRDGMSLSEANECRKDARDTIYQMLEDGDSDFLIEDYLLNQYGLEMDYIFDILM